MMKKLIAVLLAIMLLPCGTVWAEEAETLTIPADGVLTIGLPGSNRVTGGAAELCERQCQCLCRERDRHLRR